MLSRHIRPPVAAFLLALMTSAQAATADGTAAAAVNFCRHVDGLLDGPHIPDEATARAIAAAIIAQRESRKYADQYDLIVQDEGPAWLVFQSLPDIPAPTDDMVITVMGGGGLAMRIAKCDGAISGLHWQR